MPLANKVKSIFSAQTAKANQSQIDMSMLAAKDVANLALQRTESLYNNPKLPKGETKPSLHYWAVHKDDTMLLMEAVARRGEIIEHSLKVIKKEAAEIAAKVANFKPKTLFDIGCGYGLHGLFLAKKLGLEIFYAVDLEETEGKYHDFAESGAAYSNLETAKRIFEANNKGQTKIETINPGKQKIKLPQKVDFFMSLLSCGWHYPTSAYTDVIRKNASPNAIAIFDIRHNRIGEEEILKLFKKHVVIHENKKGKRFLLSEIV